MSLCTCQAVTQLAGTVERAAELVSEVKPMSTLELEGSTEVDWTWGRAGREMERILQVASGQVDAGETVRGRGEEGKGEQSGVLNEGVHDGNIGIVGAREQRWLEE